MNKLSDLAKNLFLVVGVTAGTLLVVGYSPKEFLGVAGVIILFIFFIIGIFFSLDEALNPNLSRMRRGRRLPRRRH